MTDRVIRTILCIGCVLLLVLAGCKPKTLLGPVTVASGNSTEQLLAGKLTVLALRQNGFLVNDRTGFATSAEARTALLTGSVDMGWFYTGDTWTIVMGHDLPITDADRLAQAVASEDKPNGIVWLSPSPYVLRLGLVMREADLKNIQLSTLSGLPGYAARHEPLTLCAPEDLIDKAIGIQGFIQTYSLDFSVERIQAWPIPEGYQALLRGDCDCALGYSVDVVGNSSLRFLEDDKAFFPVSGFALAIRQEVETRFPDLRQVLDRVSFWLTPAAINALVLQVEQDKQTPESVAQKFIKLQK
jgi:osmoprotectant transport system substrate-binding protein